MKIYTLDAIVNNKEVVRKSFANRTQANKYLDKVLNKYNLEVVDVIFKNNNHSQEFVCDNYNRILITRSVL